MAAQDERDEALRRMFTPPPATVPPWQDNAGGARRWRAAGATYRKLVETVFDGDVTITKDARSR